MSTNQRSITMSSTLDTSNLTPNTTIKNYPTMCKLLNQPMKTGTAKIAQMETWKCYFDFTIQGHSFIIGEIYKIPKGKQTKRHGFISYIEELILDLLMQDRHNGLIFLSRNKLFKELDMININYGYARNNIPKFSQLVNIHEDNIHEFYTLSSSTLSRSVETALNRLKSKALIRWFPADTVCFIDTTVSINETGEAQAKGLYRGKNEYDEDMYDYDIVSKVKQIHREATKEETQLIAHTEREVIKEMGYNDTRDIVIRNKWEKFMNRVNSILFEKANILFYYESYKIIFNEEHILEVWADLLQLESYDKLIKQNKLNNSIIEKLTENGENRNKNALNKELKDIDKTNRRKDKRYIDDNNRLIDILIDKEYNDIRKEIRSIKVNKK